MFSFTSCREELSALRGGRARLRRLGFWFAGLTGGDPQDLVDTGSTGDNLSHRLLLQVSHFFFTALGPNGVYRGIVQNQLFNDIGDK